MLQCNGMETVYKLLDDMKSAAKRQDLERHQDYSDQLETLVRAYVVPTVSDQWTSEALENHEAIIASLLLSKIGHGVTRDAIMDALYFDRPNDAPHMKIVDVYVCRMRKKLTQANSPYVIETVWGRGYRMIDTRQAAKAA